MSTFDDSRKRLFTAARVLYADAQHAAAVAAAVAEQRGYRDDYRTRCALEAKRFNTALMLVQRAVDVLNGRYDGVVFLLQPVEEKSK